MASVVEYITTRGLISDWPGFVLATKSVCGSINVNFSFRIFG
jgi:hypothetical protein